MRYKECGATRVPRQRSRRSCSFAFLVGCWAALFLSAPTHGQISPGPLSKAHQALTGTTQCASCHQFGASTPTFKCLDCHKEVAQDLTAKQGFHGRLAMQSPNGKECVRCHLEHNGVDFAIVHWEPSEKQFDHKQTGYALEGKHAGLTCEQCHTPKNIASTVKPLIQYKDLTRSFFGLKEDCLSCHADPHRGQLGNACQNCHTVTDWKTARNFDHSKTRYLLTGQHIQVACEKCHRPETPGEPARFRDMKLGACSDCHADPHKGSFAQRCETCHTTAGWKKLLAGFSFDHAKTKFPLLGKHADVACTACHVSGDFKKALAFANCADCHKDAHNGQFQGRPKKGECAECHNVEGWKPSLFGVKEHGTAGYPLEGKHARVECDKCHVPAGKATIYKVEFANCTDCHKDVHDGQFAGAPYNNRCEPCHTVRDFHRTLFTVALHQKSRFALTGAHAAVPCNECHKAGLAHRTDDVLPFRFEDRSCTACHTDPHHGEFQERMANVGASGAPQGCEACHNVVSWTQVPSFDHSKTNFPLLGAHRAAACGACHKAITGTGQIRFKGAPLKCEECHADPHGGQFITKKTGTTPCADCHDAQRWTPSAFDHDRRTLFPLQGGHAGVKCDRCHTGVREVAGKDVLFYKPTPTQCDACHKTDPGPLKKLAL